MIWYTPQTIEITKLSNMKTFSKFIPNENHGSEHLLLWVEFNFKSINK